MLRVLIIYFIALTLLNSHHIEIYLLLKTIVIKMYNLVLKFLLKIARWRGKLVMFQSPWRKHLEERRAHRCKLVWLPQTESSLCMALLKILPVWGANHQWNQWTITSAQWFFTGRLIGRFWTTWMIEVIAWWI